MPLLEFSPNGIYCPQGDFYIDPWKPVHRAIITHAHADHARREHKYYLAHKHSEEVLRLRLGADIVLTTVEYGEFLHINGVRVSLHPAGHIIGSSQVRVEYRGEIWVVSGDYKTYDDGISGMFEPVRCHTFVTESTFGLPIFRWKPQQEIYAAINAWWQQNRDEGRVSILCGYALGKAQRLMKGLDTSIGNIYVHGAVANVNEALAQSGLQLPAWRRIEAAAGKQEWRGSIIIAPPSALNTNWMRRFQPYSTAIASGWMQLRGNKRRAAVDRGFVLSDHADWEGLLSAIEATQAQQVLVTHGYTHIFSRYLQEKAIDAQAVETLFEGEPISAE
ncbi:MAG: ligase-associated DNA damage response exonuclease [Cytophagales bacterium]|nr:ligase-associated DNA damage response exonuclease [Bernardetiaceae bacterium]MDW8203884.1 ligase-associated DNA damage response exonuclease [Cytophagales bacterium]